MPKRKRKQLFQWAGKDIRSDILPIGNVTLHFKFLDETYFSSLFLSLPYSVKTTFSDKYICLPRHTKRYSVVVKFIHYSLGTWKSGREHSNPFFQLYLPPEPLAWQLWLKI